jgi:lipoate-protein ligase B
MNLRRCRPSWLGRVEYRRAEALQETCAAPLKRARLRADRQEEGPRPAEQATDPLEHLLLLEHPPVITLGRSARPEDVLADADRLAALGVAVEPTNRGGQVTYHGPGQLVGYPILDLHPDRRDVARYLRDLEEVLIRTLARLSIDAGRRPGWTGVWVGERKVAALGVHLSRWVTTHGFALNVSTDLSAFHLIVPCGIRDRGVTSIESLLGRAIDLEQVARLVVPEFGAVFGREMLAMESADGVTAALADGQIAAAGARPAEASTDALRGAI